MGEVLLFNIDNQRLAFSIEQVERVIWSVEVSPVPKGPRCLLGVINMQGRVIPVVHMRQLLGLPKRKIKLSDQLMICTVGDKSLALLVDNVEGLYTYEDSQIAQGPDLFPDMNLIDYVIKKDEEMILVYDWQKLIPLDEVSQSLRAAT